MVSVDVTEAHCFLIYLLTELLGLLLVSQYLVAIGQSALPSATL